MFNRVLSGLCLASKKQLFYGEIKSTLLGNASKRCYAARKGTRERKKKNKQKIEIEKVGFIPHNQRDRESLLKNRESRKFDDSWKPDPVDNVYPMKYYKWIVYSFSDAIKCFKETHHPQIYNKPNAPIYVSVELNMMAEKKNKFLDNFKRIAAIPHHFDHEENRSIVAFAKNVVDQNLAIDAGAQLSGGVELIKQIQNGAISLQDFQFIIAHPDILPELVSLRGLMKRRFPNPKNGTLDVDLNSLVQKYLFGINYAVTKDEFEKDFGITDARIGNLDMEASHLEENFSSLINDINTQKPNREGTFITRCLLWSPPSPEKLKIDHLLYLTSCNDNASDVSNEAKIVTL